MSSIIWKILLILVSIFEIYMGWQFVFLCWADKTNVSTIRRIVYGIIGIVLGTILGLNRGYLFFSQTMFLTLLFVVCVSIMTLPESRNIIGCGVACAYFSVIALLDFLFAFAMLGIIDEVEKEQIFHHVTGIGIVIFAFVRSIILLIFFLMKKREVKLKETIEEYMVVLGIFSFSTIIVLRIYQLIFAYSLKNNYPLVGTLGACTSLFIVVILIFWVLGIMVKSATVIKKLDFIELKDKMLEENYGYLDDVLQENRENIHDMKHHLQILREYSKQNDIEKIKEYLCEIEVPVLSLEDMIWTESKILNLILNQKKQEAKESHIYIKISADRCSFVPLKDYEICSLFSNLLDNALEACVKMKNDRRWIEVDIRSKGNMFFVKIANSIQNLPEERNGIFKSTKKEKGVHGLGLKSVKRIVERYDGDIQFEVSRDYFSVFITFFA